jgi:hypothetical protein
MIFGDFEIVSKCLKCPGFVHTSADIARSNKKHSSFLPALIIKINNLNITLLKVQVLIET